jgi:hypothetical protein
MDINCQRKHKDLSSEGADLALFKEGNDIELLLVNIAIELASPLANETIKVLC